MPLFHRSGALKFSFGLYLIHREAGLTKRSIGHLLILSCALSNRDCWFKLVKPIPSPMLRSPEARLRRLNPSVLSQSLGKVIGRGGTATVHVGRWNETDVAVKLLCSSPGTSLSQEEQEETPSVRRRSSAPADLTQMWRSVSNEVRVHACRDILLSYIVAGDQTALHHGCSVMCCVVAAKCSYITHAVPNAVL